MTILVRNDLGELERVGRTIAEFWAERGLPVGLEGDVNLALEEMLANVILHGYQDRSEHNIAVSLEANGGEVRVAIEDDGMPFNPLEAPEADLSGPLESRPIGGLGIHLVRSLMDRLEYARSGDRNHLIMTKRVSEA
jgi:anti-sigma regulatory factor (Ser/Thr protein kinase)